MCYIRILLVMLFTIVLNFRTKYVQNIFRPKNCNGLCYCENAFNAWMDSMYSPKSVQSGLLTMVLFEISGLLTMVLFEISVSAKACKLSLWSCVGGVNRTGLTQNGFGSNIKLPVPPIISENPFRKFHSGFYEWGNLQETYDVTFPRNNNNNITFRCVLISCNVFISVLFYYICS